ncbi:hypothetical protein E4T47_06504 [Aureobasidium subglaciale]|nr:hypothetical protein E4T47_06504 [Aureobasidium subglaciale]
MSLRNAILAGLMVVDAALATNNTYKWTVNNILADTITSPLADTLTLFATATYLGGEEIARKTVLLGDVVTQGYLTMDQINFSLEFSAPVSKNISIIWSLVNTADTNHTFTQDLQNLSNDTARLVSGSADSVLHLIFPGTIGATVGAIIGGPGGALVGAMIGKAVDLVLGSLIDNIFGCDCSVASDTITFLPGDLPLFPIQSTKTYHGLGSGIACGDSLYKISSTLTILNDTPVVDLQPAANWTVSLLDKNADLDFKLINLDDTLYSSGYPPRSWTQTGGTATFWGSENWASIDPQLDIDDGRAIAFGAYDDQASGFKYGLLERSLTPNTTSHEGCIARRSCPAITKILMTAGSLPANLQRGTYLAIPCANTQIFLTGLHDPAYKPTTEAYLINTKTGNVVRLADAPFAMEAPNDALVYTRAWSKYVKDD